MPPIAGSASFSAAGKSPAVRRLAGDTLEAAGKIPGQQRAELLEAELVRLREDSGGQPVLLELFSGAGVIAAAYRRLGGSAMTFDLDKGVQYDITCPVVQRVLRRWFSKRWFACV